MLGQRSGVAVLEGASTSSTNKRRKVSHNTEDYHGLLNLANIPLAVVQARAQGPDDTPAKEHDTESSKDVHYFHSSREGFDVYVRGQDSSYPERVSEAVYSGDRNREREERFVREEGGDGLKDSLDPGGGRKIANREEAANTPFTENDGHVNNETHHKQASDIESTDETREEESSALHTTEEDAGAEEGEHGEEEVNWDEVPIVQAICCIGRNVELTDEDKKELEMAATMPLPDEDDDDRVE